MKTIHCCVTSFLPLGSIASAADDPEAASPASAGLKVLVSWYKADWTNHDRSVTGLPGFKVLMRVDETTYEPVQNWFSQSKLHDCRSAW